MLISLNNSKLGDKIPSLSFPAVVTCNPEAPCFKECYARKGYMAFHQKGVYLDNYNEYKADPRAFFDNLQQWINNEDCIYKFFRYFASGDIPDPGFLRGMVETAEKCPQTKFLAFTKRFNFVNDFLSNGGTIPANLKIIFSHWCKGFEVPNPYGLPCTYVYFKDATKNDAIPEFAIPCTGSCKTCKACWDLQPGQSVYFKQH